MTISINDLKKRSATSILDLSKQFEKLTKKPNYKDEDLRFWKPTLDKGGNGSAVIRFLPASDGEDTPFVRIFSHAFQGPTKSWYIENSLSTIEKACPVYDNTRELWNSGSEEDKKKASSMRRRTHFISNILVVKDPGNPSNEGKVFLFKYGVKIFEMINGKINPAFDDVKPMNPFDQWTGANFRLRVRKVDGFPNYSSSEFDAPSAIGDDAKIEEIYNKQYKLQEFKDPSKFKSYAELKERFERVMGLSGQKFQKEEKANKKSDTLEEHQTFEGDSGDDDAEFIRNLTKSAS